MFLIIRLHLPLTKILLQCNIPQLLALMKLLLIIKILYTKQLQSITMHLFISNLQFINKRLSTMKSLSITQHQLAMNLQPLTRILFTNLLLYTMKHRYITMRLRLITPNKFIMLSQLTMLNQLSTIKPLFTTMLLSILSIPKNKYLHTMVQLRFTMYLLLMLLQ